MLFPLESKSVIYNRSILSWTHTLEWHDGGVSDMSHGKTDPGPEARLR